MSMTDARDAGLLIHCTLRYTYGHATSVRGRAGYINGITPQFIRDHLTSGVKGPGTKKKPRDATTAMAKTGGRRALFGVADLIKRHRVELRRHLQLDVPLKEVPTIEEEHAAAKQQAPSRSRHDG